MDSLAPAHRPPDRIYWWARQHALILLIGVSAAWLEHSGLLLAAMAGASFLAVFRMPASNAPNSPPSPWRKALLFTRILIPLGLIAEPQTDTRIVLLVLAVLTAFQLIEAWIFRKQSPQNTQQALIEQETDALWIISLTFLLVPLTPLGNGILWLALLRPLGMIASHWNGPPASPMPWHFGARGVAGLSLLALSTPLLSNVPTGLSLGLLAAGGSAWTALHAAWALRALKVEGKTP
ncbi:MAG: hypothetical protein RLZ25_1718 [Pseudomonadota bacterium]|jgi:hypothetical protein